MAKHNKIPQAKPEAPLTAAQAPRVWWRAALAEPIALGLAALILVRPWMDGITYPTDNFYFVWGILLLFALWASQVLLRGTPIQFGVPVLLLGAFWIVGAATMLDTIQLDASYRAAIVWGSHFCLFLLACNALRTRMAFGIVLTAFAASSLAETTWSVLHFHYVLPYVRESVMRSPALLKMYFGSTELSPELVHRLEVNRAFGSLLFPNALAALMIIGIPFAFVGMIHSAADLARDLRAARRAPRRPAPSSMALLLTTGLVWLASTGIAYFLYSFIATFEITGSPDLQRATFLPLVYGADGLSLDRPLYVVLWCVFVLVPPLVLAGITARTMRRYGIETLGRAIRLWVLPPWFVLQLAALWLTYSRGGYMALAAAAILGAALFLYGRKRPAIAPAAAAVAAVAITIACVTATWHARAEQPPAAPPAAAAPAPSAPQAAPAPSAQAAPALQAPPPIRKEGVDLTLSDLANPASFKLRIGYWKTGLIMASHNLGHGVGLGAFGFAFPRYQKQGVGDVKAAHNDYLQVLCETGVLGFLAFCAFWAWFLWAGARRIVRETNPWERAILAGLFAGLLAFLIHALVDFPFYNPALAFYAFLMAGLFLARARYAESGEPAVLRTGRMQLMALPMLAIAALLAGMAARAFLCDYYIGGSRLINVANHQKLTKINDAANFFVREANAPQPQGQLPAKEILPIVELIPDRTVLESIGAIHVPAPESPAKHRALQPGEPVPENAFLIVTKPSDAKQRALDYLDLALARVEEMDAIFPHNPDVAMFFIQTYNGVAENVARPDRKQRYTLELLKWAQEGVRRSPWQSMMHEWLAKAYWLRGGIEPPSARKPFYEKGIEEYRVATECYPISASSWRKYGNALIHFGEALSKSKNDAQGDSYIAKGHEMIKKADELDKNR